MSRGHDTIHAVVLAGGKGSRLAPYTATLPKPLLPVGDRAVVELLLEQLSRGGVTTVHLAVNHLAHLIMAVVGDGSRFGLKIRYAHEQEPLGTMGPLRSIDDLPEQFLVANGDILSDLDVGAFFRAHLAAGAVLTIAAHVRQQTIDYGVLQLDSDNRVVGFREKPTDRLTVSMGIYAMSREVLRYIPAGRPYGFDELVSALLRDGRPVRAYPYEGYWLDIGRPDDYAQAQQDALERPDRSS